MKIAAAVFVCGLLSTSLAKGDCPTPLPEKPTAEDLRACFAEIAKLRADIAALSSKVDQFGKTLSKNFSFTAVRFGQSGSSESGKDEGARFIQMNPQGPRRFASAADYPICGISEIDFGAAVNNEKICDLRQAGGDWTIEVTGYASCKVTCFKPVGVQ